jgi:hypothetical protein
VTAASAERSFEYLIKALADRNGVTVGGGRGFGAGTLKVHGGIFAMVSQNQLVFKLPGSRVAALIATAQGAAFDAGKGRPMKEWVAVAGTPARCLALAEEALDFVGHRSPPADRPRRQHRIRGYDEGERSDSSALAPNPR